MPPLQKTSEQKTLKEFPSAAELHESACQEAEKALKASNHMAKHDSLRMFSESLDDALMNYTRARLSYAQTADEGERPIMPVDTDISMAVGKKLNNSRLGSLDRSKLSSALDTAIGDYKRKVDTQLNIDTLPTAEKLHESGREKLEEVLRDRAVLVATESLRDFSKPLDKALKDYSDRRLVYAQIIAMGEHVPLPRDTDVQAAIRERVNDPGVFSGRILLSQALNVAVAEYMKTVDSELSIPETKSYGWGMGCP